MSKPNSSASPSGKPQKPTPKKKEPEVFIEDKFNGLSLKSKPQRPINRTGFIYDERMLEYTSLHDENYLDSPDRISVSYDKCRSYGLVKRCIRLKVTPCEEGDILLLHDKEYLEKLKTIASLSEEEQIQMEHSFHDVCIHKNSYECARLSVGATINMVTAVVEDRVTNGMAVIRPPGHHAMKDEGCGLCYFNNVAVAASHCLTTLQKKRVLIVDWDVHHGQGTQRMFYDDPSVMYISIHRYEHGWFWPNLKESNFDYIGTGDGVGYNVNIPLNVTGLTDSDYFAIFHQLIMPLAINFDPDVVIVSAGYDCALGCPEGEMKVTPPAFSHLVHKLSALADGRLAVILEGGYHIESLGESVAYSVRGLLDDPLPQLNLNDKPRPELVNVLLNCIHLLRPHWKCFGYQSLDYEAKAVKLESEDPRGPATFASEESAAYNELYKNTPQPEEIKQKYTEEIKTILASHVHRETKNRTCYVYDEFMKKHKSVLDPGHPERPERISRIYEMLGEYGLLAKCVKLPSRKATHKELSSVHSLKHIKNMEAIETTPPKKYAEMESKMNSIYLHKESYQCALMAAGSLLNVVDSVMSDRCRNGFAIIRPPGHHAEEDKACGFCFFNSVPVAARYAQQKYGAKKVAIIDWDVHHGNGTQHMFEKDSSVLYISTHKYDNGFFFPGSQDANYDKVGLGAGAGYNVNIPFNYQCKVDGEVVEGRPAGDPEYIAAFQQIIMPICYEFSPDLVIISAGFDAAKGDPLGGYKITPAGYAHMTYMLSSLAKGRLIMALEGGYNLNSISESFSSCVDVMLGGIPPRIPNLIPSITAVMTIRNVIKAHKKYWKSLCCDAVLPFYESEIKEYEARLERVKKNEDLNAITENLKRFQLELNRGKPSTSTGTKPKPASTTTTPKKPGSAGATPKKPSSSSAGTTPKKPSTSTVDTPKKPATDAKDQSMSDSDNKKMEVDAASAATGGADGNSIEEAALGAAAAAGPAPTEGPFTVVPLKWCAHLEEINPLPHELNTKEKCGDCDNIGENWVCLTCYKVYCSRYINEHMLFHSIATDHRMVLSYADLSVWCYSCDSYVHNAELIPMKNSAHRNKFGCDSQPLPNIAEGDE